MPSLEAANEDGTSSYVSLPLSSLNTSMDECSMSYECTVNGQTVVADLDPGATHCFMDPSVAKRLVLTAVRRKEDVELGDGSITTAQWNTMATLTFDNITSTEEVYVIPMKGNVKFGIGRQWLRTDNPEIDWRTSCVRIKKADGSAKVLRPRNTKTNKNAITIKRISIKTMKKLVRKQNAELFAVIVQPTKDSMTVSTEFADRVREFQDVFRDELPDTLPPKRGIDFEINLKKDQPSPVRPVIRLSHDELIELKRQMQMLLSKGLVRQSSSPYGAPVCFVKKKEGDLRIVCDYRALNKITIPDSNPIPLISEAIDHISEAKIFSKIDLLGAYHQMRIREEDISKTAIRTRYGSFERRVLCFGLTNAPASFSRLLSTLLRDLNGECLVLFLDDVLFYSR